MGGICSDYSWQGIGIDAMHNLLHGLMSLAVGQTVATWFRADGTLRKDCQARSLPCPKSRMIGRTLRSVDSATQFDVYELS